MPKDEKYEIDRSTAPKTPSAGGGLLNINPAVRRESQNVLATIGDAAGWGSLIGGTALLFTPAAPEGAVMAVQGLGALGAGAYLGEGLIDMRAGDYKKGTQKAALAMVDAMTPSARKGQAVSEVAKKARKQVLLKTGAIFPGLEAMENEMQGRLREDGKTQVPPAVESMPTAKNGK
jgi:hypothetical protein